MRRSWTTILGLLGACASGAGPQPVTVAVSGESGRQAPVEDVTHSAGDSNAEVTSQQAQRKAPGATKAKTTSVDPSCTPLANAEPKIVTGEASVSDAADTGRALIFDVAGISLELPACTPGADVRVITVEWDTKNRPVPTRIHPNFTRHAATLRASQVLTALPESPILVRLHSKRELSKPGEKLVLAVESSGECDAQHREKLDGGECSHWQLLDATFDAQRNDTVARVPELGGYRLQFGWVPK